MNTSADHINPTTEDEQELLRRLADGDQHALSVIVRQYSPVIYPYLIYWLKEIQLVEEVAQDVFMKIWRNRTRLPGIGNFAGYLYTIARNKANTALGRQILGTAEPDIEMLDNLMNNPQSTLEAKELSAALNAAIDALPPRRKEVFLLSREGGLTYEEIAERMDIARSTVNDHMVAALVFLRYHIRESTGIMIGWLAAVLLPFVR